MLKFFTDILVALIAGACSTLVLTRVQHDIDLYFALTFLISFFYSSTRLLRARNLSERFGPNLAVKFSAEVVRWAGVVLFITCFLFFTKTGEEYSRYWLALTFVLGLTFSSLRLLFNFFSRRVFYSSVRNIVVVGSSDSSDRLLEQFSANCPDEFRLLAIFNTESNESDLGAVPLLKSVEGLLNFIERVRTGDVLVESVGSVDEIWITIPLNRKDELRALNYSLKNTACRVYYVPDFEGIGLKRYELETLFNLPVMEWSEVVELPNEVFAKRILDVSLASVLLFVLSPLLAITALLIKLNSPGPIFFFQNRYGLDGKVFRLVKFRSMTHVDHEGDIIEQAKRDDQRVTSIGRFLRKYSIDEIPQLINVIRGDMSIVGPRPHAVAHNEFYRDKIHGYMSRHRVKPGITGWAQVNGLRGETPELSDMQNRLAYDLEYINNRSILLDIRILIKTVWVTLAAKNAY